MRNTHPLVSVVIPTYNREQSLPRAVSSALRQDHERIEVVVVDNGSTDGSWPYLRGLKDPRLRIFRNATNIGAVANWRLGLDASQGQYVKVLWSDDALATNAVSHLLEPFLDDPDVGVCVCAQRIETPRLPDRWVHPLANGLNLVECLGSLLSGSRSLPVSPGAGLLRLADARLGLNAAQRLLPPHCVGSAIGPDLMLLYTGLQKGRKLVVADTYVVFTAGEDSITMRTNRATLTQCYATAVFALAADAFATLGPHDRATMRVLYGIHRVRHPRSPSVHQLSCDWEPAEFAAMPGAFRASLRAALDRFRKERGDLRRP